MENVIKEICCTVNPACWNVIELMGLRAAKPSAGLHSHSSVKWSAGVSFV